MNDYQIIRLSHQYRYWVYYVESYLLPVSANIMRITACMAAISKWTTQTQCHQSTQRVTRSQHHVIVQIRREAEEI